jgi:serpin B
MGMKDFPETEINAFFRKLKDGLTSTDSSLSLAIANSVWYDKNRFLIKNDFVDLGKTYFDAPVTGLDYKSPAALATVNKWCEDNTNGKIRDMLDNLTAVEILNALYFQGFWTEGYEFDAKNTTKQTFTKSNGAKVEVDMMHKKFERNIFLNSYRDDYLSMISLPYGNKAFSMYFVLPAENRTFDEMVKQLLVPGYWSQCMVNFRTGIVDVHIPKFETKYENEEIKTILTKMGMGIAYDPEKALFPEYCGAQ